MKINHTQKLKEFEEYLKKIPEIIAVLYTGSTAKKDWDEYSDLDIDIVVEDKDYEKIKKMFPKLLSWWGEVKLINNYPGCDETYAFVGDNYLKVEIGPIKKSQVKPTWEAKQIRIAYDREGTLTEAFKRSNKEERPKLDYNTFKNFLLDTRANFFYIARHFMRGLKLSAASEIGSIGGNLFIYLGKIKGHTDYENLRKAEKHLTKKEWDFLKITSCKSLKKSEVKRALKANWEFMKYIEKEYEKKTGKKLNLKCDDKEILRKIDETIKQNAKQKK